jgi:hypothetical protein
MKTRPWGTAALASSLAMAMAAAAFADDGRPVRLIGSAPTAEDPVAKAFVLDLTVSKGEGAFKQTVGGWYAALPPAVGSGEVTGTCVHSQCAIDVDLSDTKLSLSGDFTASAASSGRFAVNGDDGKVTAEGAASFAPVGEAIPDVGVLAAPEAVGGAELKTLLEWGGVTVFVGNADAPQWPDDTEREALAGWQNGKGEPMTGLITVSDLAALRTGAETAKADSGWTALGDAKAGWSAGYPARLLPKAETTGAERRFSSADGKAVLVIAIRPPLSADDFEAFSDKLSADAPDRSDKNYTRINGDLNLSYVEGDKTVTVVCHNRAGGLAQLTFSRPKDKEEPWAPFDIILASSLTVTDDLRAP